MGTGVRVDLILGALRDLFLFTESDHVRWLVLSWLVCCWVCLELNKSGEEKRRYPGWSSPFHVRSFSNVCCSGFCSLRLKGYSIGEDTDCGSSNDSRKSKLRQCLLLMISALSIIFKSHCKEERAEITWSVVGYKGMSWYRVDVRISGGCVRVILMELQCPPFSVTFRHNLKEGEDRLSQTLYVPDSQGLWTINS